LQKGVEIIYITSGIKKGSKSKNYYKGYKKHHFATIEINKKNNVIHVTSRTKQKLEHEIGIVQNRVDLNGLSKLA
jgi:hypothetical protein